MKRFYIVMQVCRWSDMTTNIGLPTGGFEDTVGMVPVYKTREEAESHFPNAEVMEVKTGICDTN